MRKQNIVIGVLASLCATMQLHHDQPFVFQIVAFIVWAGIDVGALFLFDWMWGKLLDKWPWL